MFEEVSKQPQMEENVKHSFKAFLRMENSKGQPELMDMLPALTWLWDLIKYYIWGHSFESIFSLELVQLWGPLLMVFRS